MNATRSKNHSDIIIIGAGMAGLSCAGVLVDAGLTVRVLDKGRGPGGRMAARRAEIAGKAVSFDHGAQFFTARDAGFKAAVAKWQARGAVAPWPAAGEEAWVGTPGMNGPVKLMSSEVEVQWSTRALTIARDAGGWRVDTGDDSFTAATLLVAVPAEQAGELIEPVAPDLATIPASIVSEPCWAVMAGFEQPLDVKSDAIRDPEARISWAARNSAKPDRAGAETWVLHASPARSREIIDIPKEEVAKLLLIDFFAQIGERVKSPVHLTAHRWLYAQPIKQADAEPGEYAHFDAEARIGIAGDYLHSPRVEGAWISGAALARQVLAAPPAP